MFECEMISRLALPALVPVPTINHKTILMHYGESFSLLRKFKKFSQKKLADSVNKTQQYISELEQQEHLNGKNLNMLLKGISSSRDEWEKFKRLMPPPRKSLIKPTRMIF